MSADDLARHRVELDKLAEMLGSVISYLATDLEVAALEGRRLDTNTRELAALAARVEELELATHRTASSREFVELSHRLGELELAAGRDTGEHSKRVDSLTDPGRLVVALEAEPRSVLGQYVGRREGDLYYLDGAGRVLAYPAELAGVIGRDRLDDVLACRADR